MLVTVGVVLGGCSTCILAEQYDSEGENGPGLVKTSKYRRARPQVLSFCPSEDVKLPVRERVADLRACYEAELDECPTLAGWVDVGWTIGKDGRVTDIRTAGLKKVGDCIASVIKSIRFPRPLIGCEEVHRWPFVFRL